MSLVDLDPCGPGTKTPEAMEPSESSDVLLAAVSSESSDPVFQMDPWAKAEPKRESRPKAMREAQIWPEIQSKTMNIHENP